MVMTNEISFEEFSLDLIGELTESSIFDEYVNYDRILSESVMLSESQEVKLAVLREFSLKDIKTKLVNAFKKIKEFFQNLVAKIVIFFRKLGKDKALKEIGDVLAKMSPEERNKQIKYVYADYSKVGKGSLRTEKLQKLTKLGNEILRDDKNNSKLQDAKVEDYVLIPEGLTVTDAISALNKKEFALITKTGSKMTAYKDITKMSVQLDKISKNVTKLGKSLEKQADSLGKTAEKLDNRTDDNSPHQAQLLRSLAIPALRSNGVLLKTLGKDIIDTNQKLLKEALKLVKGESSALNYSNNIVDNAAKYRDDFNNNTQGLSFTIESYDPWAGLE